VVRAAAVTAEVEVVVGGATNRNETNLTARRFRRACLLPDRRASETGRNSSGSPAERLR
jgi:hypothetical protein